ncbi:hypothetical protein [Nocardia vaccinii]|nr:hypothetical protein [Nocardia vaccinii]
MRFATAAEWGGAAATPGSEPAMAGIHFGWNQLLDNLTHAITA